MTANTAQTHPSRDKFTSAVRGAEQADQERVAEVLGEAFHDDPVFNWLIEGVNQTSYFLRILRAVYFKHNAVYMAGDGQGAAMWLPPGASAAIPFPTALRLAWMALRNGGLGCLRRLSQLRDAIEPVHPHTPHYYLHAIGTTAEGRGKGLGSQLMRYVLTKADDEKMPAYLENSNETNMSFYTRHGFEVRQEIQPAPGCPSLWAMWREPRRRD